MRQVQWVMFYPRCAAFPRPHFSMEREFVAFIAEAQLPITQPRPGLSVGAKKELGEPLFFPKFLWSNIIYLREEDRERRESHVTRNPGTSHDRPIAPPFRLHILLLTPRLGENARTGSRGRAAPSARRA